MFWVWCGFAAVSLLLGLVLATGSVDLLRKLTGVRMDRELVAILACCSGLVGPVLVFGRRDLIGCSISFPLNAMMFGLFSGVLLIPGFNGPDGDSMFWLYELAWITVISIGFLELFGSRENWIQLMLRSEIRRDEYRKAHGSPLPFFEDLATKYPQFEVWEETLFHREIAPKLDSPPNFLGDVKS